MLYSLPRFVESLFIMDVSGRLMLVELKLLRLVGKLPESVVKLLLLIPVFVVRLGSAITQIRKKFLHI